MYSFREIVLKCPGIILVMASRWWRYACVWVSMLLISVAVPSNSLSPYSVMSFKFIFSTRLGVIPVESYEVLLLRLISFMKMFPGSYFWHTSLCLWEPSTSASFVFTVRMLNPATLCLGWRQWRHLECFLLFSVVKSAWSFLNCYKFPPFEIYLDISSR